MKTTVFAVLLCLNLSVSNGQITEISREEARKILIQINESTLNARNFSSVIKYQIFKLHTDSIAADSLDGYYKRKDTKEHSLLIGVQTIQNENERLVIDTTTQTMSLLKPNAKPRIIVESMNAALSMCTKILLIRSNGENTIKLYIDEGEMLAYNAVEICYDNQTHFISSLTLFYTNTSIPGFINFSNPKLKISFKDISTSRIPDSEFSVDAFILKNNNKYVLSADFKHYSFYNHIN